MRKCLCKGTAVYGRCPVESMLAIQGLIIDDVCTYITATPKQQVYGQDVAGTDGTSIVIDITVYSSHVIHYVAVRDTRRRTVTESVDPAYTS